ncbi:MAG: cytochrome c oxidase subunit I [Deltaproteobacteria bacterium HGW-Deltaproteobacteria-14]|jgi:cytochrome c oxidase subunit 1|nr:MAG: cytochrome c oxidase subunit I [Deltaproteobacteria bacterium HGW-Deltaproteobacteria-14]
MATTTVEGAAPAHEHAEELDFYKASRGIKSWLLTLDHKRIGLMYLAGVLLAFFAAGVIAIIFRAELMTPQIDLLAPAVGEGSATIGRELYNKLFTLHGAMMVFVFIIPAIPAALGNFLLPLMLGAKDVAFPRLNLLSFYVWLTGTLILILAILAGQLDTGWTFYTPYSTSTHGAAPVVLAVTGAFVLGFSSILTGLNFVVTVHKMRAPGLTWNRMPLMIWALYSTAVIQVLATPVLAITLLLLLFENAFNVGIFNPAMGGDPVLFQHFFWFYSHPAVYIMILPGFGIISEIIAIHSRKHIFGYKAIALSSVSIAVISFLVWGHHMFVSGQSEFASALFSFLTFAVAVPTAIKVFSWVATLYKGSISFNTPMLYGLIFIFTFSIGGLTGLHLGTLSTDVHFHDSYFVVAHFHYVMMGGTVIAFIGGLHHWFPKMFGKMYNENHGRIGALLVFLGFNLTFFSQFVLGAQGMPRRYAEYDPEFQGWHVASSIGSFILAAGLLWTLIYLLMALKNGKKATANPWGGASLEWATSSPPIAHNFHDTPHVDSDPYNFPEIDHTMKTGHH